MPRNGTGIYQLPSDVNPVVEGTIIDVAWANPTLNDVANGITDSLPRDGQAPMTGALKLIDGTSSAPSITFNADARTGPFRPVTDSYAFAVGGVERGRFIGSNFLIGGTDNNGEMLNVKGTSRLQGKVLITTGGVDVTGASTFNTSVVFKDIVQFDMPVTGIEKAEVGLGNVDNTSDVNKPLSNAFLDSRRGTITAVAYNGAPAGALLCNGQAVSRTTYAALYALVGTTYGTGDGTTTFNVPDLRGVALRGLDEGRGLDSGRTLGSYQADDNKSHNHGVSDPGHAHSVYDPGHAHGVADPGHAHAGSTSASGDHTHGITVGNTYIYGGAICASNVASGTQQTGAAGNHAHSFNTDARATGIGIYAAATGIGIYGNGTGITLAASGGTEARMKNVAIRYVIWY